jgi:hypothetical protein
LQRYAADLTDGDALLAGLYTFAAAKDYLTMAHLGLINKLGEATVQRIGSTLKEVLYENPLTEAVLDYQLFHESFREYLVKEKALKVQEAGERIIDFCAGWRELEGSWEQRYALEHYAAHLAESKRHERAGELIKLLYDKPYATSQKKVLKNFNATAVLYRQSLLKASEQQLWDDQLEAALNLVDLHYEEANDAPQVVAMVANGEIDLALKRIESFGGADKDGVERKFILYMLCLLELTLLESKDKPFRKSAIERLLCHLDEHLPIDHSILKWNDFFPSYLMFSMACEWAEQGFDYQLVYKRTDYWELDWIANSGPYSIKQLNLMNVFASQCYDLDCGISNEDFRIKAMKIITLELLNLGRKEEALAYVKNVDKQKDKSQILEGLIPGLVKLGNIEEAIFYARGISDDNDKERMIRQIAVELAKIGQLEEAQILTDSIGNFWIKSNSLLEISYELVNTGKLNEALSCAMNIGNDRIKCEALQNIFRTNSNVGILKEAEYLKYELIKCARSIGDENSKNEMLKDISIELSKIGNFEESVTITQDIRSELSKCNAQKEIAIEQARQGRISNAIIYANNISLDSVKCQALNSIFSILFDLRKLKEAASILQEIYDCTRGIGDEILRSQALTDLSCELYRQGDFKKAKSVLNETLELLCVYKGHNQNNLLHSLVLQLVKQSRFEDCIYVMGFINNDGHRQHSIALISLELFKNGRIRDSFILLNKITHARTKKKALYEIFKVQYKDDFRSYADAIQEYLIFPRGQNFDRLKSISLQGISCNFCELDASEIAIIISNNISDLNEKIISLMSFYRIESSRKYSNISEMILQIAISTSDSITTFYKKAKALEYIFKKIVESDNLNLALSLVNSLKQDFEKSHALKSISSVLAEQGNISEARLILLEAIELATSIDDDSNDLPTGMLKERTLSNMLLELISQGFITDARTIAEEHGISGDELEFLKAKIAGVYANQSMFENAMAMVQELEFYKYRALQHISVELIKHERIEEALASVELIEREDDRIDGLIALFAELAKVNKIVIAEMLGLKLTKIGYRQSCWKKYGSACTKVFGEDFSLKNSHGLKSNEDVEFYLKGWAEEVNAADVDEGCLRRALPHIVSDSQSIELVLQKYAAKILIQESPSPNLTDRLNRTLNIQWALDIAAQFPKPEATTRFSTNLDTWLHEIADEDDREQIELWAKQVVKGKITEEEFGERVNGL